MLHIHFHKPTSLSTCSIRHLIVHELVLKVLIQADHAVRVILMNTEQKINLLAFLTV